MQVFVEVDELFALGVREDRPREVDTLIALVAGHLRLSPSIEA
jgi:hypothetical protein